MLSFDFIPTSGAKFLKWILINRSVFVQPRYAQLIKYDLTNSDGIATTCLGF